MTKRFRRFVIWTTPLAAGLVLLTVFSGREKQLLRLAPVQTLYGWGYQITIDNKPFIHQDCIPAIPGYQPFRNKEDAMRVGSLVVYKIRHKLSPAVTRRELDSLRIQL
ncbi:DUF4907 domain-containing protein [Chitinophaga cymbidii]|uniref:DUF4907 domain-containing protein n=1 Tax=Chitinophaga cymbidii TaxID=1096750 RepID=A0A512RL67_9BACT|nr:DUF4907 domain-containing protein [Chitinophaga cymbidii]GEP96412.1 hypothetical protein CCY01nite_26720 [Chitinophaga cymbidii]